MTFKRQLGIIGLSTAFLLASLPPVMADNNAATSALIDAASPVMKPGGSDEAAAEAKISKDQAVKLAEAAVSIPEGFRLRGINFYSNTGVPARSGTWNLQYEKSMNNTYYGGLSVSIDADSGRMLNFSRYENDPDRKPSYPPKTDLQAARKEADALLLKMNPAEASNVKYNADFERNFKTPLNGNVSYMIRYDRTVDGVRFPQDYISFTIDGDGTLTGYDFNWSADAKFEEAAPQIKPEDALKTYKEKLRPMLQYITINPGGGNGKPVPALTYSISANPLDAKTGEFVDPVGGTPQAAQDVTTLTDKPLAPKPEGNLSLTKEQAIARVVSLIGLPEGAVLENASYNENVEQKMAVPVGGSVSSWYLNWKLPAKDGKQPSYINASVNSKTGEIISYGRDVYPIPYADQSSGQPSAYPVTADKAKAAAVDFIKKVIPYRTDELSPDPQSVNSFPTDPAKSGPVYQINFRRIISGILVANENVGVGINLLTGEVVNFWNGISAIEYPAARPAVIPVEQAKSILLSRYTLELQFLQPIGFYAYGKYDKMAMPVQQGTDSAKPAKLVYMPVPNDASEPLFLDAVTGEWKSWDTGEVTVPGKIAATDIVGHWAQRELQLMIDYRAIDVRDGKVNPDQAITRGEMIKMLMIALNGGYYGPKYDSTRKASFNDVAASSPYFGYVESAVDANILDRTSEEFKPEAKLNREELARLIVRALGYNKLAETPGLFNLAVADAAKIRDKGQVAIILALGIMTASDDGNFAPAQQVSRAQAATAFFRFLQKRPELQDGPIRK